MGLLRLTVVQTGPADNSSSVVHDIRYFSLGFLFAWCFCYISLEGEVSLLYEYIVEECGIGSIDKIAA